MHSFGLASCDGFPERTIQVDGKPFTCVFVADGQMRPLAQQSIGLADVIVLTYSPTFEGMKNMEWWLHECQVAAAAGRRRPIVMLRFAGLGGLASRVEEQKYRDREDVYAHHTLLYSRGAFDREHPDFAHTSETFDEVLTSAVRSHWEAASRRRARKTCSVL